MTQEFKELLLPREHGDRGWFVAVVGPGISYYLHSDFKVHHSTRHNGVFSGYFASEEDAHNARNEYYRAHTQTVALRTEAFNRAMRGI